MSDNLNQKYVVTVDTNIFYKIDFNFEHPDLKKLKDKDRKIIFADVVYWEVIKHFLKEKLRQDMEKMVGSIKTLKKYPILPSDLVKSIERELECLDNIDLSKKVIDDFCQSYDIEIVEVSKLIDFDIILDMYTRGKAPFENNDKKSSEFQDGITLVGLEEWAKNNNCYIIAISGDKGWEAYAENSSNILKVYDNIPECLENILILIDNHTKEYLEELKLNALEFIHSNSSDFSSWVQDYIEQFSMSIIANSPYYYDSDDEYITYIDHKINNDEVNIVDVKDDFFEIKLNVDVIFEANANFRFYVKDSIDKDYVFMGSSYEVIETENNIDLLIRFYLNGHNIQDLELINTPKFGDIFEVDFDWVEPNWDY